MDWREFIAALVGSLAWPLVVLATVFLLRSQLVGLFDGTLRRVKVGPGGFEAEWDRAAEETVASTARALPGPQRPGIEDELKEAARLIDTVPTVAVTECFAIVEKELRRVFAWQFEAADPPSDAQTVATLIRVAYDEGAISEAIRDALRGLNELRNLAAHDPTGTMTTPAQAREFFAIASSVLFALDVASMP